MGTVSKKKQSAVISHYVESFFEKKSLKKLFCARRRWKNTSFEKKVILSTVELEARGQQNASINKSSRDFDPEVNIDLLTTIFGIYQKYLLQNHQRAAAVE